MSDRQTLAAREEQRDLGAHARVSAPTFTKDAMESAIKAGFMVGVLAGWASWWLFTRLQKFIDEYLADKRQELEERLPPSLRGKP